MPKSRSVHTTSEPPPLARPYSIDTYLSGGNGSPVSETDGERLTRMENVIQELRHEQDVQLRRIAELQAQLDRQTPPTHDR